MNKARKIVDLSFVGKVKDRNFFWKVPDTDSYADGVHRGKNMAAEYLEQVKCAQNQVPILPSIIFDATIDRPISDGRKGQLVGFFSHIEYVLKNYIK